MRSNRRRFLGMMGSLPAALALSRVDALAFSRNDALAYRPAVLARQTTGTIHGINPADMDFSVSPRDDFYRFANGGWLDRVTIPSDRSSYGVFVELRQNTTRQLLGLLDNLANGSALEAGSDEWKAVQLFRQGTDLATRNQQGIDPIRSTLNMIRSIEDTEALHAFFMESTWLGVSHVFGVGVDIDLGDSSLHSVYLGGPSLGMPNRDYYLEDTPANEEAREAYIASCADLLVHAGHDAEQAADDARAVYEFERQLAAETLTREEQQDFGLLYNPISVEELIEIYPRFDWRGHLESLGLAGAEQVIAVELGYMQALDGIMQQVPLEVVKDFLMLDTMWTFSSNLSEEIETTAFAFGSALSGVDEQQPLDERVLDEVDGAMTDALGRLYVAAYFPPEAKQRITELVDEIISAFAARLDRNTWMTPETKLRAAEKLGKLGVKVGYPEEWETYENVEIAESYAQSALNAGNANARRQLEKFGEPVDKSEWGAPAQLVNAFYNPLANDITFPAAILQPPFFDYQADPASNLGAIGYVIGHEITHGFDQGGAQFDGDGNLANWWTEEDFEAFEALNQQVVEQYSAIEVLPGVFIDGQITIGENVADLGGIQAAFDALTTYLQDNGSSLDAVLHGPLTSVDATPEASPIAAFATPVASPVASPAAIQVTQELSQAERFFVAAATVWRTKIRDEALTTLVQTDTHSPGEVRATQPSRNMDAFHETIGTEQGDAMYMPEDERIVVW